MTRWFLAATARGALAALLTLAASLPASAGWKVEELTPLGTLPKGGSVVQAQLSDGRLSARVTAILFQAHSYTLRVVECPVPGSTKIAGALDAAGCVAGVNGGYFQPDFRPVGLAIADGREVHAFERAKLLSGILAVRDGGIEIVRSSEFKSSGDVRQAIQCGPMLLEKSKPTAGLNAERPARRTVVATDGRGRWALLYLTSVTLADAARILAAPGLLVGWAPATALNLDGGSSSGLWAACEPARVSLPEFGHVRNSIGIAPKQ
ncbi:MAG: phosphodiester glycosidase family protein [Verrucomicrobiae bacterium]